MNFYAFDFETASYDKHSACSIAIVKVENSRIVDEFYTLIKPETPFFWRNTQIHGIHMATNSALFSTKSVSGRSQCKFRL